MCTCTLPYKWRGANNHLNTDQEKKINSKLYIFYTVYNPKESEVCIWNKIIKRKIIISAAFGFFLLCQNADSVDINTLYTHQIIHKYLSCREGSPWMNKDGLARTVGGAKILQAMHM